MFIIIFQYAIVVKFDLVECSAIDWGSEFHSLIVGQKDEMSSELLTMSTITD